MALTDSYHELGNLPSQSEILAAIVESSDDAILTKDLNDHITSWNRGAERLFGYTAAEVLGKPITILIPPDRLGEEVDLLARIRRGERTSHFETIRLHRSGREIHISLTVSPLRNEAGQVIGSSKIARDITERHQAQEMQRILIGEMQHRIKNVFALAGSLVSLSAQRVETKEELVKDVRARLHALSAAHQLTVPALSGSTIEARHSTFRNTLAVLLEPYLRPDDAPRMAVTGPELVFARKAITPVALLINELITNAVKHGALRDSNGGIGVTIAREGDQVTITWEECHSHMGTPADFEEKGFGSSLARLAVEQQLGGQLLREWRENGLRVVVTFNAENLDDDM